MKINVPDGETATVILLSGARLAGEVRRVSVGYGEPVIEIDGWRVDPDKVQAWKLGVHPYRAVKAAKE